jgi:lysophospholipase L1-like esterase
MLGRTAFWLMLPVSAVQGLWLRNKASRLPGAPGPRQGSVGEGATLHLLAIGDSIIDGVGISHTSQSLPVRFAAALARREHCQVNWRIEGKTGFNIDDVLERLAAVETITRPDLVLLSVGVNDVTGLSSTRHWRRQLTQLLKRIQQQWPGCRLIFAGLPPMSKFPLPPQPLRSALGLRAARLDRIAAAIIAQHPHAIHVPTRINPEQHGFCEDGFHPSAESCNLWAIELAAIDSRREST